MKFQLDNIKFILNSHRRHDHPRLDNEAKGREGAMRKRVSISEGTEQDTLLTLATTVSVFRAKSRYNFQSKQDVVKYSGQSGVSKARMLHLLDRVINGSQVLRERATRATIRANLKSSATLSRRAM